METLGIAVGAAATYETIKVTAEVVEQRQPNTRSDKWAVRVRDMGARVNELASQFPPNAAMFDTWEEFTAKYVELHEKMDALKGQKNTFFVRFALSRELAKSGKFIEGLCKKLTMDMLVRQIHCVQHHQEHLVNGACSICVWDEGYTQLDDTASHDSGSIETTLALDFLPEGLSILSV
uniref:Fungal N-terminal domain-containing protein n=1 Tax=Mycena chlorophos TaxID=658473 RepID=A0ABQ0M751_MYCCL|nr:predicted protein [Mycena chlorophos]